MKKAALLVIALVAVAALGPATAAAKQLETGVEFEIYGEIDSDGAVTYYFVGFARPEGFPNLGDPSDDVVFLNGKVDKTAAFRCATGRLVELFRDEPEGVDAVVGRARSEFSLFFGQVALPAGQVPGAYYAQVSEKVVKGKGRKHKIRCLAGTSPTITVHPPQFG